MSSSTKPAAPGQSVFLNRNCHCNVFMRKDKDMKKALIWFGMLAVVAGSAFAQDDPAKIKAKMAADKALSKAQADIQDREQKKRVQALAEEINAIKLKVLEATLEKVVSQVLTLSKNAQLGLIGTNVKNAPYSAEAITEARQVLADGTRIEQRHSYKIYRDSQGRLRRESESGMEVWIIDPVASASYVLDVQNQIAKTAPLWVPLDNTGERAFVKQEGARDEQIIVPIDKPKSLERTTRINSLGRQIIEGVEAEGRETIETINVGTIGNDRPIIITSESWYSLGLRLQVMTRHYDPRTGESTFRLSGLRRDEPAPDLFRVPANYRIVSGK